MYTAADPALPLFAATCPTQYAIGAECVAVGEGVVPSLEGRGWQGGLEVRGSA